MEIDCKRQRRLMKPRMAELRMEIGSRPVPWIKEGCVTKKKWNMEHFLLHCTGMVYRREKGDVGVNERVR